ncbi:hypothetical protein DENIS_3585 [Desulfonema ishimotonii]|uniref:J domain-containing protein n=1 Tax=Desulfonema ishimotonii TaxID=45657 RepID=A0A401G0A7_9BACT|nr:hypothetical protein [Desulfonema ishimotonii]GBC62613.1 hypothetical protein DENIS_3585 [Desulfonema ishimotonii]
MNDFYWLSLSEGKIRSEYDKLKVDVLSDTGLEKILSIKTSDDLVDVIEAFKKATNKYNNDKYFKSEKHKLAFMILKHQGNIFDEDLGIKKKHYVDKDAAKEWKKKYQAIFHPDKNINDDSIEYNEVMQKINKIFNRMVGKA